jgi:hypothetical protein
MSASLHQIRVQVVRLERYCRRAKDKVWAGDRRDLIQAMADTAETAEISRRIYSLIEQHLSTHKATAATKDDPNCT